MTGKVLKLNHTEFTQKELSLVGRFAAIFDNPDEATCQCGRYKEVRSGPCLFCTEDLLRSHKSGMLKRFPDRWPAGAETIQIAKELIANHHQVAEKAEIAYLFKTIHGMTNGKVKLGACTKQSPTAKLLHGWDYIIELAWDMWAMFTDRQREALLLHEITHIDREDGQWKIRPHDVEEHVHVIEAYGLWKPDLELVAEAILEAEGMTNEEKQAMLPGM